METEIKKTPFYSQKLDDKYSILGKSIGIDTQTKSLSTRTIECSSLINGDLNNQQLTFSFTVSPSAYIDWNNCNMEIGFVFKKAGEDAPATKVSIPWNLLLFIFEEIKVQFNGTTVFNKVAGEYLETQTFKLLTEYTNADLNNSEIVFAPVGDYNYNVDVKDGYEFTNAGKDTSSDDPNGLIRFQNWISPMDGSQGKVLYKRPTFKDLFFNMPGFSKNLRNVNIVVKIKQEIPLAKITDAGNGIMVVKSMKLQLHEYNFSPSAAISALNNKINGEDEHLSFIDVNKQERVYSPYITVTNQENVQWVAAVQFCHNVTSIVPTAEAGSQNKGKAEYQNCGQFLLMNGYATAGASVDNDGAAGTKKGDATIKNLIHRSDLPPTTNANLPIKGTSCYNPMSSIQAQYGSITYPSNAIDTQVDDNPTLLKTDELYAEYRKAVGFNNPAVPEDIFKRTMPFFMVKFTPNIKLIQSGDIIIRMPGFSGENNTAVKKLSILYGQLKSYNISPSGIVSETVSSF